MTISLLVHLNLHVLRGGRRTHKPLAELTVQLLLRALRAPERGLAKGVACFHEPGYKRQRVHDGIMRHCPIRGHHACGCFLTK